MILYFTGLLHFHFLDILASFAITAWQKAKLSQHSQRKNQADPTSVLCKLWNLRGHLFTFVKNKTVRGTNEECFPFHHKAPGHSNNLPLLYDCYKVTFVERSHCESLDCCEDNRMHRIKSVNQLGTNDLTG